MGTVNGAVDMSHLVKNNRYDEAVIAFDSTPSSSAAATTM